MTIQAGSDIVESDFINQSEADPTPANDEGRVPKLESDGKISPFFIKANNLISGSLTLAESIDGSTTPVPVFVSVAQTVKFVDTAGTGGVAYINSVDGRYGLAFKLSSVTVTYINRVTVSLLKTGSPGNLAVSIWSDNTGSVGTKIADVGTILASAITGSYTDVTIDTATPILLQSTVWVVFDSYGGTGTDTSNYYTFQISSTGTETVQYDNNSGSGYSWNGYDASMTSNLELTLVYESGKLYKSDANVASRAYFHGFVTENKAQGETTKITVRGIQGSFSGLTINTSYYVSDTIGTIATSGTGSILVGKSISATEIII